MLKRLTVALVAVLAFCVGWFVRDWQLFDGEWR